MALGASGETGAGEDQAAQNSGYGRKLNTIQLVDYNKKFLCANDPSRDDTNDTENDETGDKKWL